jgi:hypothetical protein
VAERLQIRAKPSEGPLDDAPGARAKTKAGVLREALQLARATLPSRDPTKSLRPALALYLLPGLIVGLLPLFWLGNTRLSVRGYVEGGPQYWKALALAGAFGAFGSLLSTPALTFLISTVVLFLTRGSRSRVSQALVCPYCRDSVTQEGTVACARKGCGALYHRECWNECAVQYGGCAIYGCSSKKSREVTAAGYLLRLSRLAVAAALFPPRMARALRDHGSEEFTSVYRRAVRKAIGWHGVANGNSTRQFVVTLVIGLPIALIALVADVALEFPELLLKSESALGLRVVAFLYGIPFSLLALPFLVALPIALAVYSVQAIATIFMNELAALTRADEGGGSVLGRLRAGLGGKKDCC